MLAGVWSMRKLRLTQARQKLFLEALADTGSVIKAAAVAATSRTRVYELRKLDPSFAGAWAEAEEIAADRLQDEARRRAVEGVPEPLVSAGKLVRDDNGQPIMVRRYSDRLLMTLINAHRAARRERSKPLPLLVLQSAADAPNAMALIAAAVAAGTITPAEAGELLKLVENYLKALVAQNALQKTGAVTSIEERDAVREELHAYLDELARRVGEPELADDSPDDGGGSTD
jgi:hypothetical protein